MFIEEPAARPCKRSFKSSEINWRPCPRSGTIRNGGFDRQYYKKLSFQSDDSIMSAAAKFLSLASMLAFLRTQAFGASACFGLLKWWLAAKA
jgi:hypothetical protein